MKKIFLLLAVLINHAFVFSQNQVIDSLISIQAYKKSVKIKYLDGISRSATIIGGIYSNTGNYSKALEYYLKKLKAEETRGNSEILTVAIMQIAMAYQLEGNFEYIITIINTLFKILKM